MRLGRAVITIFFVLSFLYLLKPLFIGYYPDFSMHYFGTQALFNRESPYEGGENFFIPHVYPPFTSVFFVPLMALSYDQAEIVWTAVSIGMYIASIILLLALFNRSIVGNTEMLLFGLLNFTFFPLKFTLGMGQVNTFVLLCVCLFVYFVKKVNNPAFAGSALAFSLGMKLFPLLLIPYLLVIKKWNVLVATGATGALLCALSVIFFGWEIHAYFLFEVLPTLTGGWKDYYYNQSFSGFISVLIQDEGGREFFYKAAVLLILVPASVAVYLKRKNVLYCVSLIIITSLLINKFSWQHHYVLLIPSFFMLVFSEKSRGVRIFTAAAYSLVALNLENPLRFHPVLQFHVVYGGIVLYVLTLYRLLKGEVETKL